MATRRDEKRRAYGPSALLCWIECSTRLEVEPSGQYQEAARDSRSLERTVRARRRCDGATDNPQPARVGCLTWAREVWVVQDIKSTRPNRQAHPLGQREFFVKTRIDVGIMRPAEEVPRDVSERCLCITGGELSRVKQGVSTEEAPQFCRMLGSVISARMLPPIVRESPVEARSCKH